MNAIRFGGGRFFEMPWIRTLFLAVINLEQRLRKTRLTDDALQSAAPRGGGREL